MDKQKLIRIGVAIACLVAAGAITIWQTGVFSSTSPTENVTASPAPDPDDPAPPVGGDGAQPAGDNRTVNSDDPFVKPRI